MKKFYSLFFILLAFAFQACQTDVPGKDKEQAEQEVETPAVETPADDPTTESSGRPVWVKNVAWETVRTDTLAASITGYRAIDSLEALKEEIDAHNLAYPDNPWHLYVDTVPSIEDAPMAEIWIVDPVTYALKTNPSTGGPYHLLFARIEVIPRRWAWEMDAEAVGGKLYIDYPPPSEIPPPLPPTAEELYARYSIYVIDPAQNGKIIWEVHCTEWESMGYESLEICYYYKRQAAYYDTLGTGYVMIEGYVYTEPE